MLRLLRGGDGGGGRERLLSALLQYMASFSFSRYCLRLVNTSHFTLLCISVHVSEPGVSFLQTAPVAALCQAEEAETHQTQIRCSGSGSLLLPGAWPMAAAGKRCPILAYSWCTLHIHGAHAAPLWQLTACALRSRGTEGPGHPLSAAGRQVGIDSTPQGMCSCRHEGGKAEHGRHVTNRGHQQCSLSLVLSSLTAERHCPKGPTA